MSNRRVSRFSIGFLLAGAALCAAFGLPSQPPDDGAPPAATQSAQAGETGAFQTDKPPVMPLPSPPRADAELSSETVRATDAAPEAAAPVAQTTAAAVSQPVQAIAHDGTDLLKALTPAIIAILLAIFTRQVVLSLSIGIFAAAAIMLGSQGDYNPIHWTTFAMNEYLFGVLAPLEKGGGAVDLEHIKILVFTLLIGAMIGVIEANGGTHAMVARVTRRVKTRRTGQLSASTAGLVVFFDDYANSMIIGPSMRPIFDRLRLSREKLAYIVDSTAAPVSSIFIGTWLAAEVSYLETGFQAIEGVRPAFLDGATATSAFWASIPYRTYALLAIVMVFIIAITGRDFGAMRKAESRAATGDDRDTADGAIADASGARWWLGAIPVLTLVGSVIGLLVWTGLVSCRADGIELHWGSWQAATDAFQNVLKGADSYPALVYGALISVTVAIAISVYPGRVSLAKTMDGFVSGMCRIFAACIVLVLAWGISQGGKDLHLGEHARAFLQEQVARGTFSVTFLPLAIFVTASIVSFSTGTSFGTMGIMCPAVIPIAAGVLGGLPADQALPLFYASVGAVLTGAVFGDHCSPISDTTVLSSIASECDLSAHVWTQMPYALTVAVVGLLSMDGLNYALLRWAPEFHASYYCGTSWAYGLALGTFLLLLIVLIFGRRPKGVVIEPQIEIGN